MHHSTVLCRILMPINDPIHLAKVSWRWKYLQCLMIVVHNMIYECLVCLFFIRSCTGWQTIREHRIFFLFRYLYRIQQCHFDSLHLCYPIWYTYTLTHTLVNIGRRTELCSHNTRYIHSLFTVSAKTSLHCPYIYNIYSYYLCSNDSHESLGLKQMMYFIRRISSTYERHYCRMILPGNLI